MRIAQVAPLLSVRPRFHHDPPFAPQSRGTCADRVFTSLPEALLLLLAVTAAARESR